MAETSSNDAEPPAKPSRKPLLLGLALAIVGGAGGFFAVQSGLVSKPAVSASDGHGENSHVAADHPYFVALEPLVISLNNKGQREHLRFAAQLDVAPEYAGEVKLVEPRILDILNGYLRAVDPEDFERPAILMTLRAQMLHRVRLITGEGRVNDLLITEFVIG